ncbi:GTP 3',8-cyclase MoaA [Aliagarivorans marinus]|uniref:GTP 3',8-cyclase MoaA n=1 Tax=Aliagarivorans marinus TaxID=561965 RepID=UPI00041DB42C|nr:GTP 3',8-cyclase MoaA [Aliagarivorans marinus]
MLQDSFSRKFYYLRLSITDACNFSCQYCLPDGYQCQEPKNYLSGEEITRVVRGFAKMGTNKVRLTGGEPSLRKDFEEIIARVADVEGVEKVAMTTNGFRLARKAQVWRDAGLNCVNVSVDSLDPREFNAITGTKTYTKVMDGVEAALQAGFERVKVNAVLLKGSAEREFDQYLDWIKTRALDIRFIELMEMGQHPDYFRRNHISGQRFKTYLKNHGWQRVISSHNAGPAQIFAHPDYQGRVGLILPYEQDFCASCNRLRVSSTGKLHLCLFGEQGYSLRHLLEDDQQQGELMAFLEASLREKKVSHFLQEGNTGATPHLASIGG